jgi:hypothetical protein
VLIKGLPRDALVRTPESERGVDAWTAELELLAQLIEVTSIGVAEMKLHQPITVPRPTPPGEDDTEALPAEGAANPYSTAIGKLRGSARPQLHAVDDGEEHSSA